MKSPAFQFYVDDFLGGTMHFTDAEVGLYMRLLCVQFGSGSLPDDGAMLSSYGKGGTLVDRVKEKFKKGSDGRLRNLRLEAVMKSQAAYRKSLSDNGSAGNKVRWGGDRVAIAKRSQSNRTPSPSPVPSSKEEGKKENVSLSPSELDENITMKGVKKKPVWIPELPASVKTEAMVISFAEFVKSRAKSPRPLTEQAAVRIFKDFEAWGERVSLIALDNAIKGGWTGVFYPREDQVRRTQEGTTPPRLDSKPWNPDPLQQRLNRFMLFPRPDSQPWSDLEQDAFDQVKNKITEQHFAMVERFHSTLITDGDFRFKSLLKLLQNWFAEVKKSREFLRENPMLCLPPGFNNPGRNPGETDDEQEERGRQMAISSSGGRVKGEIVLDSDPSEEDPEGENEND